ncbi:MAG: hypothetical protein Q9219_003510 [cf. Caloplaca sp. 3 TL-2023]
MSYPSKNTQGGNPYGPLNPVQETPGNAPLQVSSLHAALPDPRKSRKNKRPADVAELPAFSEEELARQIKKFDTPAAAPVTTSAPVTSTAQPPAGDAMEVDQAKHKTLDMTKSALPAPFRLSEIPIRANRQACAVSFMDADGPSPVIGGFLNPPNDWEVTVNVNAGRISRPSLTFELRYATQPAGKPMTTDTPSDGCSLVWHPAIRDERRRPMIGTWSCRPLEEWLQEVTPAQKAHDFLNDPNLSTMQDQVFVMQCQLRSPIIKLGFENPARAMKSLPGAVQQRFRDLTQQPVAGVTIFVRVRDSNNRRHLSLFTRRVTEDLGFLSQYSDPLTKRSLLTNVQDSPSVDRIEHGLYRIDDKQPRYRMLPKLDEYLTVDEFRIYNSLTPIREAQIAQGRDILLQGGALECFCKAIPKFRGTAGREAEAGPRLDEQKAMDKYIHLYVRFPSGEDKEHQIPEIGSRMKVVWDNSDPTIGKPHHDEGQKSHMYGQTVLRDHSEFTATRTDFCILLDRSRSKVKFPVVYKKLMKVVSLPRAHISVYFNPMPPQRELDSVREFCSSSYPPIISLRSMLMHGGSHTPQTKSRTDLALGVPPTQDHVDSFTNSLRDLEDNLNSGQLSALEKLRDITGHVLSISGPPGTGKTRLLSLMVWILMSIGHRVFLCAASNAAVDNAALKIRAEIANKLLHLKLLRLHISSIEKSSIFKELAEEDEPDMTKPLPARPTVDVKNDPRVRLAFRDLVAEHAAQEKLLQFQDDFNAYKFDYNQVQDFANRDSKVTAIPFEMTLGGQIFEIMKEDRVKAEAEYDAELKRNPTAEDIPSASDRNPSKRYSDFYELYIEQEGRVDPETSKTFFKPRAQMEERAYKRANCICSTLTNVRAQLTLIKSAKPTIIIVDEAGQATLPALFGPLTAFTSWDVLILAGDWKQLLPTIQAKKASEVADTSQVSVLERLESFNLISVYLDIQYRMDPEIASFISRVIYGNRLKTHELAKVDNPIRQKVRAVSQRYGIKLPTGSVYFMIDVIGVASPEPNGTSLQNFANANVIEDLLNKLHVQGIPSREIDILCFYEAQTRLIQEQVKAKDDGSFKYNKISTVKNYQGGQSGVVIADFVIAAGSSLFGQNLLSQETTDTGMWIGVNSYARDWHRLNVSLTRAMDGLILVGQLAMLCTSLKKNKGKIENAMFNLADDIQLRGLVCHLSSVPEQNQDLMANLSFIQRLTHSGRLIQQKQIEEAEKRILGRATTDAE